MEVDLTALQVAAGIQIGNTVTTSYIIDCYPLQTTSVITFYAVFLNLSAFINPVSHPSLAVADLFIADQPLTFHLFIVFHCTLASVFWLDLDICFSRHHCNGWRMFGIRCFA